jgi:Polyketide cyclase / dehydrase and lipid transport
VRVEHGIRTTIDAPLDAVWAVLGEFGDVAWYPQVSAVELVGGEPVRVGSIRQIWTVHGATIRERLEGLGPGHQFSYSFDGAPIVPVQGGRTTVSAVVPEASPDKTVVAWRGEFDVADAEVGQTVEHINCDVVWPGLVAALASKLGVDHTLATTDQAEEGQIP